MSWLVTIALQPSVDAEDLQLRLWELGTTGIAEITSDGIDTLIAGFDSHEVADLAASSVGVAASVEPVDPEAWPVPEPQQLMVGGRLLTIEVARAFGHGHHPTTKLTLEAVTRRASPDTSVLDIGTGTGILALAAAALGAAPVVGIDIDPAAVEVARRNAASNQLDVTMSETALDQLTGEFDLVVVNMLAAELDPLAPFVYDRLASGGTLVVSGFLVGQREWVTSLFDRLTVIELVEGDDEWARIEFILLPETVLPETVLPEEAR